MRPFVGSRRRWDDNIKINIQKIGCNKKEYIPLNQENVQWWNAENDHILNHQVVTVKPFFCSKATKQNITQIVLFSLTLGSGIFF